MPRRTKKKKADAGNTYYKAKNGRFYKKIQIDGKTKVRFVTNAEATGAMKLSKPKTTKPKRTRKKVSKAKQEVVASSDDQKVNEEEKSEQEIIDNCCECDRLH